MTEQKAPSSPSEWVLRVRNLKSNKNLKDALAECANGLKLFPDSIDLLFSYGELRVSLYNKEKKPDHLKNALVSFEKLLQINPHHYMANLQSAKIYFMGGAWERAGEKVDLVLSASPNDAAALEIKEALLKKTSREVSKEAGGAEVGDIGTEKIEGLESGEESDIEKLIANLSYFSGVRGIVSLHLIDPTGVEIKNEAFSGGARTNVSSHVANIFRNSSFCTKKMGLGNFQKGRAYSKEGSLVIVNVFYAILAILAEPSADLADIDAAVRRYIEDLVL